jgi:hypothetical protein
MFCKNARPTVWRRSRGLMCSPVISMRSLSSRSSPTLRSARYLSTRSRPLATFLTAQTCKNSTWGRIQLAIYSKCDLWSNAKVWSIWGWTTTPLRRTHTTVNLWWGRCLVYSSWTTRRSPMTRGRSAWGSIFQTRTLSTLRLNPKSLTTTTP